MTSVQPNHVIRKRVPVWIIERLNDVFITDNLTDKDMLNYAYTVRDKLAENEIVMKQIANNNAVNRPCWVISRKRWMMPFLVAVPHIRNR